MFSDFGSLCCHGRRLRGGRSRRRRGVKPAVEPLERLGQCLPGAACEGRCFAPHGRVRLGGLKEALCDMGRVYLSELQSPPGLSSPSLPRTRLRRATRPRCACLGQPPRVQLQVRAVFQASKSCSLLPGLLVDHLGPALLERGEPRRREQVCRRKNRGEGVSPAPVVPRRSPPTRPPPGQ